jgi:hypothetical protein
MTHTAPPAWFLKTVNEGLAKLYALCLDGCPAADALKGTAWVWSEALWDAIQYGPPSADVDADRLASAFRTMCRTLERWPAPAILLRHLPPRVAPRRDPALPLGDIGNAERARRRSVVARACESAGLESPVTLMCEHEQAATTNQRKEQL